MAEESKDRNHTSEDTGGDSNVEEPAVNAMQSSLLPGSVADLQIGMESGNRHRVEIVVVAGSSGQ